MMLKTFILIFAWMASVNCKDCQPSTEDLVDVLEKEVDSYDQFIYGRYLESEEETCQRVNLGIRKFRESFYQEMAVFLSPARRQLETVKATANGTDAGPCVEQMVRILDRDLKEENSRFLKCLEAPAAQLEGLKEDLSRDKNKYTDLKTRTKAALKSCLVNLPSTCPIKTTPCMDTQINYFNTNAKELTESRLVRGPCMEKSVEALQCFSKSVESYIKKARKVQRKTTACISFEDDDSTRRSILAFAKTLIANSTLLEQVQSAQQKFEELNRNVVCMLGKYYALEKSAKITYKFSPHDKLYFKESMDVVFAGQLREVEEVRRNKRHVWPNKTADECCDKAMMYIHNSIANLSSSLEKCEGDLLQKTLVKIQQVRAELGDITKGLTKMGDPAIMDCLNSGAILTEDAVEGCYDLQLRLFRMNKQDALERVNELMRFLQEYNNTYFFNWSESTNTLCSNSLLDRTRWFVDKVMFQLNRCPYKGFNMDDSNPRITTSTEEPSTRSTSTTATTRHSNTAWYYVQRPTTTEEVTDYPE